MALSFIELLVQLLRPPFDDSPTHQAGYEAAKQDEAASESVEWLLRCREKVWAEPVAFLGDAVGYGNQGGLLALRCRHEHLFQGKL